MKRKNKTVNISILIFIVLVVSFFCAAIKLLLVALSKTTDGINLVELKNSRNTVTDTLIAKRG